MSSRVEVEGLTQLMEALGAVPDELRTVGMNIVQEETEDAAEEIRQAYPRGATGNLQQGVKVEFPSSTILVGIIRSTAQHAHLYEFGTQQRATASGANRGFGPPHPVTVPIAQRRRRVMLGRLVDLVREHGFEVSGDVG